MNNIDRIATDIEKKRAYKKKEKQCLICGAHGEKGFELVNLNPIIWICSTCVSDEELPC